MNATKHTLSLQQQLLMPTMLLLCAQDTSSFVVYFDSSIGNATPEGVQLEIVVVQSHELPRIRFMMLNTTLTERVQEPH